VAQRDVPSEGGVVSVIFIVVPLATLVVLVAVVAFVASVRKGQFDDLDTPAVRILHDDER